MSKDNLARAPEPSSTSTFDDLESNVQSYARSFPVIFDKAEGPYLYDDTGKRYIDFLAGAGSLNYGHNNPAMLRERCSSTSRAGRHHPQPRHAHGRPRALPDTFAT
jgi:diaminobutyrate-2-oxoglutarate transaminase